MEENNENKIPDWLKNLQENSWELELLVSGGAVFTLLQMSDFYLDWIRAIKITAQIPGTSVILIMGMFGIKILTSGFILHLILRAFWLGLVCVNYVYPGGIVSEKIKLKSPFRTRHVSGDLKEQIMHVDRLCGTIMYTSIISAAALAGITFLLFCIILLFVTLENNFNPSAVNWISMIFIFQFWFYIIDLLLSGFLRKIPFIAYLFFPFFKIFDYFSFRFFYQRSLNLFSTNVHKVKFFAGAVVFASVSVVFTYLAIYRTMKWPNLFDDRQYKYQLADAGYTSYSMYRDEMDDDDMSVANIQSKIINSNCIDLFVRYDVSHDNYIDKTPNADTSKRYSDIIEVSIDDSVFQINTWYSQWDKEVTNIGVNALIDIAHISRGNHQITVATKKSLQMEYDEEHPRTYEITIPFFKDL